MGIFLEGEDSRGDHVLGSLVEFRFKAPPGTTSSSITTHTPSGQRNCASWASQPQKSVTLLPCSRREDHEVHEGHVVALEEKILYLCGNTGQCYPGSPAFRDPESYLYILMRLLERRLYQAPYKGQKKVKIMLRLAIKPTVNMVEPW